MKQVSKDGSPPESGRKQTQDRARHGAVGGTRRVASSWMASDGELTRRTPRILRYAAVRNLTGLSRTTLWRLERVGAFPKHVQLSSHTVGWIEADVIAWIRSKARQGSNERNEHGEFESPGADV